MTYPWDCCCYDHDHVNPEHDDCKQASRDFKLGLYFRTIRDAKLLNKLVSPATFKTYDA
jgi:hypothetical protein